MEPVYQGLGRCVCAFWLAVAFDIVGLTVLLVGVFVNVFFYDLLIYAGAIVIFLSLIWWVFWYSGNIEVPPAELEDDVGLLKKDKGLMGMSGAVRRFSSRIRNSFRRNGEPRSTRSGRGQWASAGPPVGQQVPPVAVAMATITQAEATPQVDVSTEGDYEIVMPRTS